MTMTNRPTYPLMFFLKLYAFEYTFIITKVELVLVCDMYVI